MKLYATCPCGAAPDYQMADGEDHFINAGGAPDAKGRIFTIRVTFDDCRDAHKNHTSSPLIEVIQPFLGCPGISS